MTRPVCPAGTNFSSLIFCILFALTTADTSPAEAKRVLVLHSFVSAAPPFTTHSVAFETELTATMGGSVDLDEVSLDVARYTTLDMEEALVEFMRKRQAKWQPDLVVPIGSPAGLFVGQYRDRLFPKTTPIIYTGMDQRRLPAGALQQNAAFVGEAFDLPGLVEDILQIAPGTTNIAVVIGASPLERFWADVLRREYARFTNRVSFSYFSDLSFEQMLEKSSTMPPHSFILLILLMRDAMGVTHDADEALKRIHAVANAPINGIYQHQLGLGIVGGRLYQAEREGIESARIAVRVLRGEPITNFAPVIIGRLEPRYDWRELQRWKISKDRLPSGSNVLFREPTNWERYRWEIIGIASVMAAQAILISLLLANRIKRRRAEGKLRESEERMTLAADAGRLGMWVWDSADTHFWASEKWREIHGYSPKETIRYEGWMERVHPEDRPAVEHALADALKKHAAFHLEHRILLRDGTVRWMSKTGRVEPSANGDPVRLLGIAIDITERKETESAAREVSGKLITAQEDERKRIARDLHDDLNQRLALLSMETDLLGRMEKDSAAKELIGTIASHVSDLSSEVHKLSYQLHPAKLYQLGLVPATRSLCHELSKQFGISVEFKYDSVPRALDQDVALCLYRIVQEGLQNIIKHSGATHAEVSLGKEADALHLVVSDNGQGFDMKTGSQHAGLGLVGMRERVRLVHGQISFNSAPGRGTQIEVTVPVAPGEASNFPGAKAEVRGRSTFDRLSNVEQG